jgi:hypothetical protein
VVKKSVFTILFLAFAFCFCCEITVFAQGGEGQTRIGDKTKKETTKEKSPPKTAPKTTPKTTSKQTPKTTKKTVPDNKSDAGVTNQNPNASQTVETCSESDLLIRCGSPECNISIDGKPQGITNLNGELQLSVPIGRRKITVNKNGYEPLQSTVVTSCGELAVADLKLKPKPYQIKLKTNLPECDIFINDPPVLIGKTDLKGNFIFTGTTATVFVQARKTNYLSESKNISPETAQKEILFDLRPIPSRIILNVNVPNAFAQISGEEKLYDTREPFLLEAGRRNLTVSALGYKPFSIEIDVQANQRIEKNITLELLSTSEIISLAEKFHNEEAFAKSIQLSQLVLKNEPQNASANRLMGMILLEKQNYLEAESYLIKAIDGGEIISFKIRRHFGEKFELNSGHGKICEGLLLVGKSQIEFRGFGNTAENFNVPVSQIQIVGLQLRKNTAISLSIKVVKKEYNFFSRENELSQSGKSYLEMIQRLMVRAKS